MYNSPLILIGLHMAIVPRVIQRNPNQTEVLSMSWLMNAGGIKRKKQLA